MRKLIPTLLTLLFPFIAFSSIDSLIVLDKSDTVYIEMTPLKERAFVHVVKKSQTLYSIAKFYGMSVAELFYYNPDLETQSISVGQKLKIQMPKKGIVRQRGKNFVPSKFIPVCYVVRKKETLYRIAKSYFNMPMDTLIVRNKLSSPVLSIGQVLHVGWMRRSGIPQVYRKYRGQPLDNKNQYLALKYIQASQVKKEHNEHGVAYWQDVGVKSVDLYALHRTAPRNSIIALTNPMTKRTVYAKVIGTIPDTVHNRDVITVISSRVAKLLGAKDQRAYVKLRYLK